MMLHCRQSRGFTLIEMLIAAGMGTFIALVALSGLRSVTAARSAVDQHSEVVDELRIAASQLRSDLNNIRPNGRAIRFEGLLDQDGSVATPRLIFRTFCGRKARADQPESDYYEMEYFITTTEHGKALMRRVCPVVGIESTTNEEKSDGGILEVVADPVASFDVGYFDGGNWTTQWSSENNRPPQLVLINIGVGQTLATGKKKLYTRQVAVGFNQGQYTEEINASDFDWQQVEGQWQQTEISEE